MISGYAALRFILFAIVGAAGFILVKLRVRASRKRLAAIDRGQLCIACESIDVGREGTGLRCHRCGYYTTAELMSAKVSDAELVRLNQADDRAVNGLLPARKRKRE